MCSKKRVLLVGWDAADWKVMNRLMDHGLMPHTKRLVENGVMGNLATLSPILSPMLWASIATGKRPFKHGILGFIEPTPDGSSIQPVSNLSRKTKALWNILNQHGKRCLVVGWWPSHPVEPINGVMVSNHYQRAPRSDDPQWPMAADTVHPPRWREELAELRVHPLELSAEHVLPFIPHAAKIDQDKDRRLATCVQTIAECTTIHSCMTHLMEHEPWDFAAVYYDAIDHFQHGFMKYHPPRQDFVAEEEFDIYQNVVSAAYVYHDMMLGRLLELAGSETTVILVSDHGFHSDHLRPRAIPHEPAGPAVEHRDFGIFVMAGPGMKRDALMHGANLLDIAPTILALYGLPVAEDMDGRPLLDVFQDPPEVQTIPTWDDVPGNDGRHNDERRLDVVEAREGLEQLVALGYIDRPPENSQNAVAQTKRELKYNLALSYIDAGMHPKAVPLLIELYRDFPLEFRYGIQLAMCLRALDMIDDMARLVDHLNACWRRGALAARERLQEIAEIAEQRRKEKRANQGVGPNEPTVDSPPHPPGQSGEAESELFDDAERRVMRSLRFIARGNERTLDYLASYVALARNDPDRALVLLAQAQAPEIETPGLHLQIGQAYLELKRYEDAQRCYRKVLGMDPENPNARIGLCRIYLLQRRNRAALEEATAAVGLKYHFPPAHFFLGIARHRLGDVRGAVESLERALEQNPNFAEAHSRLALIYGRRLHDAGLAREHRRLAQEIRREHRLQRRARSAIELPPLEEVDVAGKLPSLPHREAASLKPPLSLAPDRAGGLQERSEDQPSVIIVSGLPRSGTSMMMQMLAAGGIVAMTDGERVADENNLQGYLELERVKQLHTDNSWLDDARGKVLKVVAPLIPLLPQDCAYRVVMMERNLDEIVASQGRMLARMERAGGQLSDGQLRRSLSVQLQQAKQVLAAHRVPVLTIDYGEVLRDPGAVVRRLAGFLELDLDEAAMSRAVHPSLYRERASPADAGYGRGMWSAEPAAAGRSRKG